MSVLLSTKGLSRSFNGMRAVHEVDFELAERQVRALIGPNGAGKTTFVSMLVGQLEPTSGEVWFDGRNVTHQPVHKRISLGMAYTFQITSVFSHLTLRENVALAARRRLGKNNVAVQQEVETSLTRIGLSQHIDRTADELSYGHQRLLEIAMGIAQKPRLLILDEPTQGLAESEIAEFKVLVRELVNETTILLIEHNMSVVMEVADRITVLNFGEVLAEGPPDEIHANPQVQTAYLGGG